MGDELSVGGLGYGGLLETSLVYVVYGRGPKGDELSVGGSW